MHPHSSRATRASNTAPRLVIVSLATTLLVALAGLLAGAPRASAAPGDPGDPGDPGFAPASISAVEISPAPAADGFVPTNALSVSGTASVGSTISVSIADSAAQACTTPVAPDGSWTCPQVLVENGMRTLLIIETDATGTELGRSTVALRVLGPPSIAGPALGIGIVRGSGAPAALIRVTAAGPVTVTTDCAAVDAGGSWNCMLLDATGKRLPSGTYSLSVRQGDPSAPGHWSDAASRSVVLDTQNPAAPVVALPTSGTRIITQPTEYAGTGETGATVHVFVTALSDALCTAPVLDGRWSCMGMNVPRGSWGVHALQWDAAGNPGPASAIVDVHYGRVASAASPTPPPAPPLPQPTAAPPPEIAEPAPFDPWFGSGIPFSPPDRGQVPPLLTWGTPTGFGWLIPTPTEAFERGNWLVAPLLAVAFITLVALPLRMLMRLAAGAPRRRGMRLTGRNRAFSASPDDTPLVRPWVVLTGSVIGAAVLSAFSVGLLAETRYLRLLAAIAGGIVLVNVIGIGVASRVTARSLRAPSWLRLVPGYLVVAAAATLLSRVLGVNPPIILGVLIAATIPLAVPRAHRALIALAQLGALLLLAVLGWAAVSAIGRVDGFWASGASELAATVCLAGFGSAVALTLPVRALPGRILFAWSPWVWAGTTFAIVTLAAVVLMAATPTLVIAAVAVPAAFTVLVVAAWLWRRYVQA